VAVIAAHPQEAVFQTAALEVSVKLPADMIGQVFALPGQLVDQRRVVRFDELVEECLLGVMPFVGAFARAIPALCQHASSAQRD